MLIRLSIRILLCFLVILATLHFLVRNNVVSFASESRILTVPVNGGSDNFIYYESERGVLVIIDAWDYILTHDDIETINELSQSFRDAGGLVVHSSNGYPSDAGIIIDDKDIVTDSLDGMLEELENHNAGYIFYAGYYSNICLLGRETGIASLVNAKEGRYRNYIVVIRDMTKPASVDGVSDEDVQKVTINIIENALGMSTTKDGLLAALRDNG